MADARRRHFAFMLLAILVVAALFASLSLGSVRIPVRDVFAFLSGGEVGKASTASILRIFRLPKAITALLAGAALAASGLVMQTLFRNPLAGPFILGLNSGASLGVALVVLAAGGSAAGALAAGLGQLGTMGIAAAAAIGSAAVMVLVVVVSRRVGNVMTLLILGLLFSYAVDAVTTILMHSSAAERINTYISWTFGSFGGVTWQELPILAVSVFAGLSLVVVAIKPLNALLLGEHYARSLGTRIGPVRLLIIVATALLSGSVTAFCGPIGFIGIAVPHLARSLFGTSDHRTLVPGTVLLGALAALVSDIVAGVPGLDAVLPLNAVTALIGAPVVGWVILRRRNLRETFAS